LEVIVGTFFKDDAFEFMMNIALGATHHRGVDIGESLSAAASMEDGDYEGWYHAWLTTAERVHGFAQRSAANGHQESASARSSDIFGKG
jgi:hypothetical protein